MRREERGGRREERRERERREQRGRQGHIDLKSLPSKILEDLFGRGSSAVAA